MLKGKNNLKDKIEQHSVENLLYVSINNNKFFVNQIHITLVKILLIYFYILA